MQDNKIHLSPQLVAEGGWLDSPGGKLDLESSDILVALVADGAGGLIMVDGCGAVLGSANFGEHGILVDWIGEHLDAVNGLVDEDLNAE